MPKQTYEDRMNSEEAARIRLLEREVAAEKERAALQPKKPEYGTIRQPSGELQDWFKSQAGEMISPYAKQLSDEELKALPRLQQYASSTERSPWASLMFQRQGIDEMAARDQAQNQGAQAAASAWNQAAMRGGVTGGQRERGAISSSLNTANNLAEIGRQGQTARLGIDTQEAQDRLSVLKSLPGFELQKAELLGRAKERDINQVNNANELNIGRRLQDVQGKNAYDLGTYSENMKAWAAERTAQAQEKSGK